MKEQKTKGELESMILAELNDPRVRVSVGGERYRPYDEGKANR
jgi:hypothetical protein